MMNVIIKLVFWITPLVYVLGVAISLWAFLRSRKAGYILFLIYFLFLAYVNFITITVDRYIDHKVYSSFDQQVQQEIYEAVDNAAADVMKKHGAYGRALHMEVEFPYGAILLVLALWMLASKEKRGAMPAREIFKQKIKRSE